MSQSHEQALADQAHEDREAFYKLRAAFRECVDGQSVLVTLSALSETLLDVIVDNAPSSGDAVALFQRFSTGMSMSMSRRLDGMRSRAPNDEPVHGA
jgi:hypothetical protein